MIRIEEIISNALAGIEETEVAILARELLKTREALALAQQAKGDAEGRAAMADRRALGMKPHVFAAMVNEVRALARQYGQMEQFRCRVADLLGTYIRVEHNSKGLPEAYPGQREHVAFLGALKYEIENPTPDQKPTSFDINRDYFEHYANVFSKDNERMAHGVGFMNGAAWHREHYTTPDDRVLGEVERKVVESCLKTARSWLNFAATWTSPTDDESALRGAFARSLEQLDALRANQGGLNHVHV